MSVCQLNLLPVELIHNILKYLSSHEIFHAFSKLSDYINAVLISYDRFSLNFCSILKWQFDITCNNIRPSQVISLTLDDDEIPDQSEIFFSHFTIEQFIHLRSFNMSLMSDDTCKKLSQIDKLQNLLSLSLPCLFRPYNISFDIAIQNLLPRLNRLMLYDSSCLQHQTLPNLHHLTLKHCNKYVLPTLFNSLPNLRSLDVVLILNSIPNWTKNLPTITHLKRLILRTYTDSTNHLTMKEIEEFLCKMPNVMHLELDIEGYIELIDGQRWESIVSNLIVFDFQFNILSRGSTILETNPLQSFRSLFWLETKRWFVAYHSEYVPKFFTVPRFAPNIIKYPNESWPPLCTSNDFYFDKYVSHLHLSLFNPFVYRFTNLTSLFLSDSSINSLRKIVECMPLLHSLKFRNISILAQIPDDIILATIHALHIFEMYERQTTGLKVDLNRLCFIFPRLERLTMELATYQDLCILINQLKYLSIGLFQFSDASTVDEILLNSSSKTYQWIIKHCRRLRENNNFTCRLINNKIYLWINYQKASVPQSARYSLKACFLQ